MVLYTEQDFAATKRTFWTRVLILALIIAAMIGLEALFLAPLRSRYAVWIVAAVGCCLSYAYLTTQVMPWYFYMAYQSDMRHGLSRETDAWYVSCADSTRVADGVEFHEFIVRVGDGEEDERLFFWDDDKKLPELREGQKLHIRSFGNYITELQIME